MPGTPQYLLEWSHATNQSRGGYYLGSTYTVAPAPDGPDNHNLPTILADSAAYLHLVLGGHQELVVHYESRHSALGRNQLITSWNAQSLRGAHTRAGSETYPAAVFDPEDALHIVMRGVVNIPGGARSMLHYMRKRKGQRWENGAYLVDPGYWGYSVFYHELTQDHRGRQFARCCTFERSGRAHDVGTVREPELMITENGTSWRLATTEDFVEGLILPAVTERCV